MSETCKLWWIFNSRLIVTSLKVCFGDAQTKEVQVRYTLQKNKYEDRDQVTSYRSHRLNRRKNLCRSYTWCKHICKWTICGPYKRSSQNLFWTKFLSETDNSPLIQRNSFLLSSLWSSLRYCQPRYHYGFVVSLSKKSDIDHSCPLVGPMYPTY